MEGSRTDNGHVYTPQIISQSPDMMHRMVLSRGNHSPSSEELARSHSLLVPFESRVATALKLCLKHQGGPQHMELKELDLRVAGDVGYLSRCRSRPGVLCGRHTLKRHTRPLFLRDISGSRGVTFRHNFPHSKKHNNASRRDSRVSIDITEASRAGNVAKNPSSEKVKVWSRGQPRAKNESENVQN